MPTRYAVDTNVLLRLSDRLSAQNPLIVEAMRGLGLQNAEFCFTAQNLGEFWNVSTRPITRNGFGLSIQETFWRFRSIQENMTLLPETEAVFQVWLQLLQTYEVRGTEVHDAHLAAVLQVHQVTHLLTFNGADFKRFPHIVAVHPQDLVGRG